MAGMNGVSSSNSVYSQAAQLPGFGGLASGLDRDTLIEQMTSGTRAKIAKMNQKIDLVEWTQEAIRGITDKMYDFSNKYMSFSSSSNLISSKLFSKNQITPIGVNSKYIGISGNATGKNMFSILGVKQMAQDAKITNKNRVSDNTLKTGDIDFINGQTYSTVKGDKITFELGDKKIDITISETSVDGSKTFDLKTKEGIAAALNDQLANNTSLSKLNENLEITYADNQITFSNKNLNNLVLVGGSGNILTELGFTTEKTIENGDGSSKTEVVAMENVKLEKGITSATSKGDGKLTDTKSVADLLKNSELTFNYNGKSEKITIKAEDLYVVDSSGKVTGELKSEFKTEGKSAEDVAKAYQDLLQGKLDKAFGKNRITVELGNNGVQDKYSLNFRTTVPGTTGIDGKLENDYSSVLSITGGTGNLMGKAGALGIEKGESNRLNLSATLAESGLKDSQNIPTYKGLDGDPNNGKYHMKINDKDFYFDTDTSVGDMIKQINESDAGVTISYQSMSDKFTISSNHHGSSGELKIEGELSKALFGATESDRITQKGQDAIVTVKYDGESEAIDIVRDSNGFTLEGLEVSVKGTFGDYTTNPDGTIKEDADTTVTFNATIDSQKTVDVVKDMVKDINELIELVNKEMTTKPNRDYQPLTDAQRKEMSEDEIEKWEKKAKEGLLFNDSDLRGLSNALRFSIPTSIRADLEKIGISVSKEYKDNGKLVVDEEKLKTALEQNPEHVRQLFAGDGTKENKGLMGNIKESMDKYSATTGADKGILVRRAGSTHAPTSMLQNQMLTQINDMKKVIDGLNARLKNEQDRYIKQFTSLETLISQMNSQSSYFASIIGGY